MIKTYFPFSNGASKYDNNKLCVCFINNNGNKKLGGLALKPLNKFWSYFFFRGFAYFFYGLWIYIKSFFLIKKIDEENERTRNISHLSTFIASVGILLLGFIVFFFVSGYLPNLLFEKFFTDATLFVKNLLLGLMRVGFLYVVFLILKFSSFFDSVYSFNGAASKLRNSKEVIIGRIYPLNYLNFILNIFLFSVFVLSLVTVKMFFVWQILIDVAVFLFVIPLVYEFLHFASFGKIKFLKDIALITNLLVCNSPKTTQNEVVNVVEKEMNFENFVTTEKDEISLSCVYAEMETKLRSSDKFEKSDQEWIVATVLGKNRAEVKLVRTINIKQYREIMRACERRAKGEPLSSIFGFVDFYGLKLDVNKKVLSPRMETEILVEEALKKIGKISSPTVLDLCTGSGAIAIAVAKNSNAKVSAIDISKQALSLAENNAKKNNVKVEFIQSDLFNGLKKSKKYDIIISNPPYISSSEIEKLDIEVKKYDPRLALDGGEDGLDFYRKIISSARERLNKGGYIFFELGNDQRKQVEDMLKVAGFDDINIVEDYNKIERIIYGRSC
jgi:release factor glutamine methyltransferase